MDSKYINSLKNIPDDSPNFAKNMKNLAAPLLIVIWFIIMIIAAIFPTLFAAFLPQQFEYLYVLPTRVDLRYGEQKIYYLVNELRRENGLNYLIWNEELAQYARKHSIDMASKGEVYHNTVELRAIGAGENVLEMPRSYGGFGLLPYFYFNFYRTGESLWKDSVKSWMGSPGHRSNALTPSYTHTGIGIKAGEDLITFYISQEFR